MSKINLEYHIKLKIRSLKDNQMLRIEISPSEDLKGAFDLEFDIFEEVKK